MHYITSRVRNFAPLLSIIILLSAFLSSCGSTQTIVDLESNVPKWIPDSGKYYQDVAGHFPQFAGVWTGLDADTNQLTITLDYYQQLNTNYGLFMDCLIGEYEYASSLGQVTLSPSRNISEPMSSPVGIFYTISSTDHPQCVSCAGNEARAVVTLLHHQNALIESEYLARLSQVNGQDVLTLSYYTSSNVSNDPNLSDKPVVAPHEFVLYRQ